jgi:hypothetical protein
MSDTPLPDKTGQTEAPKKHSLFSRILVATAFSTVGAKIGFLGSVADANAVLKEGTTMTFGQKIRASFNGTLIKKLGEKVATIMEQERKGPWVASAKVMKYTLITTGIGTVGGAILGWIRGGRVESWKDIFKHPIDSTKLILGFKRPGAQASDVAPIPGANETPENSDKWQNYVQSRQNSSGVSRGD